MPEQSDELQISLHRAGVYANLAILCGMWFLLTGWLWTYLANLVIAYPVGITGFFLWRKARALDPDNRKGQIAIAIHGLGLAISVVSFFLYR